MAPERRIVNRARTGIEATRRLAVIHNLELDVAIDEALTFAFLTVETALAAVARSADAALDGFDSMNGP